ncbi:ABC-2 type transport system permease protein [Streptoalloteichus tenebrarius]|uniref:ABC-2 type transport system permease protein n=1 Tax=Streptoalloteichus tenebrarius (strain ATCC 17920 / DSM 40477 / JCM 4838 / CBS 697.72 / NBRC 16177 / NCIMB 11028 / NRRL B-12390 / A12253. 1 / ISP 5477) TaxID=1933 RepID=A0ABT1HTF4_STRSD|nr:ABC transporter permease [Streptoalloteichus tenebrarius]MCP2258809.1 ABC-2 type transport system permease protein [Streptoalloteichus tenebrarius]BFE99510.1 ABC transporter permease [Streptoalloteichus tenebrarius]
MLEHDTSSPPLETRKVPLAPVPGPLATLARQLRFDLLAQVRNPASALFTLGLPLLFLVTFTTIGGGRDATARYYAPATMAISAMSATFTSLVITLTYLREYGMLKHAQLLPVRAGVLLASRVLAASCVAAISIVLLGVVAVLAYDVRPEQPVHVVAAMLGLLIVGNALGIAITPLMPNETAASPISNAVSLPMLLLSGAFFSLDAAPEWIRTAASALPVRPLLMVAIDAYAGRAAWSELAVAAGITAGWVLAAVFTAAWLFTWIPRRRR